MQIHNKILLLVGIMGAGKTRTGKLLARRLGLSFIDSDHEVARTANHSIPEIFEKYGEAEFRRLEREVMLRLLDGAPCVLAAGGGGFVSDEIRDAAKEKAISVWLKADIETLVKRLSRGKGRPMLKNTDIGKRIEELLEKRAPAYAEADITIVTDGQTPQNIVRLIETELERHADSRSKGSNPAQA